VRAEIFPAATPAAMSCADVVAMISRPIQ
jgi:hypothetical protein